MSPSSNPGFRIVQAVQEFSQSGGTEKVAFELQRVWQADGTDSTVLAATVGPEVTATEQQRLRFVLKNTAERIPTRGSWRHVGRSALVPAYTLAASAALRSGRRPDGWAENAVVLSHGDSFVADVIVLHAVNAASLAQKRSDKEWRWALNPLHLWVAARDRLMLRGLRAQRYVAVSHRVVGELERFHGIPRERITVIPNGTDIRRFSPNGPSAGLRQQFGIQVEDKLLLFVGHEFDRKGLAHLIGALRQPGLETAHVVAVGAGDESRYGALAASMGVRERIHFAGPRQDLPEIYRDADAFVFPTSYETFSLVCMEAMASGVPVFATRVGGIEDYLVDGVNGFGIERDPAAIASTVGGTLSDKPLMGRLRNGARATALQFGWETVAGLYRNLLLEIWREKKSCKLYGING